MCFINAATKKLNPSTNYFFITIFFNGLPYLPAGTPGSTENLRGVVPSVILFYNLPSIHVTDPHSYN